MAYEERKIGGDGHVAIHDWKPLDEKGKHKNSSTIEHDIDETRHTMDVLMDSLTGRLHPKSIIDKFMDFFERPETRDKTVDTFVTMGSRLSESFRRNPLPLLVIGAGAAWLLFDEQNKKHRYESRDYRHEPSREEPRSTFESTGGEMNEDMGSVQENIQEKMGSTQSNFQDRISSVKSNLQEKFESAKEKGAGFKETLSQKGEQLSQQASEASGRMKEQYSQTMHRADESVHENALIFGIATFATGIIAGLLFPSTQKEKEVMGRQAQDTIEKARMTGESVVNKATDIAQGVQETVREEVNKQNLTPEQISAQVKQGQIRPEDIGQETGDIAKAAIDRAIDESRRPTQD